MLSKVGLRLKLLVVCRSRMIQPIRNGLQCLADFMPQFLHNFSLRSAHQ